MKFTEKTSATIGNINDKTFKDSTRNSVHALGYDATVQSL